MSMGFLAVCGVFLLVSGLILFLLRGYMARFPAETWEWLPEKSKFRTYEFQRKSGVVGASIVAIAEKAKWRGLTRHGECYLHRALGRL
ncbi:hypothetical protein J2805_001747 [Arthrobacter oryzae]|nr:hypothetical protein [Arthrobacter oryzae]